jgi:hypothetical protein
LNGRNGVDSRLAALIFQGTPDGKMRLMDPCTNGQKF